MGNHKIDVLEVFAIILLLVFTIIISLYHISCDGYMGLTKEEWNIVWAISENSLSLIMSILLSVFGSKTIRLMFFSLFIPYFIIKLIYHFSVFSQVYVVSREFWEYVWSFICVFILGFGLFYCSNLLLRGLKDVGKKVREFFRVKMVGKIIYSYTNNNDSSCDSKINYGN